MSLLTSNCTNYTTIYAGYTKGEIIKKIDLNKEKTQSYTFIEKTQKKTAIKIYEEKFT